MFFGVGDLFTSPNYPKCKLICTSGNLNLYTHILWWWYTNLYLRNNLFPSGQWLLPRTPNSDLLANKSHLGIDYFFSSMTNYDFWMRKMNATCQCPSPCKDCPLLLPLLGNAHIRKSGCSIRHRSITEPLQTFKRVGKCNKNTFKVQQTLWFYQDNYFLKVPGQRIVWVYATFIKWWNELANRDLFTFTSGLRSY